MVAEKILHTDTTVITMKVELKELAALQAVEAMK
jgi:hypothetical protein